MNALLLHGFTGGAPSWDELLSLWTPDGAVLTPDLLGHGHWDGEERSFRDEVERLRRLMAATDAGPWHIVGYSLGGRLALGTALEEELHGNRPPAIAALTLVGANPGLADAEARRLRRASDESWAHKLEEDGLDAFLEEWSGLPLFRTQEGLAPARREAQERVRRRSTAAGLACSLRRLGTGAMPDYGRCLGELRMPVTWIAGELDEKFCRLGAASAARCPQGRFVVVPGVGHNVLLEAPEHLAEISREDAAAVSAPPAEAGP